MLRRALWPHVGAERQGSDSEAMLAGAGEACAFQRWPVAAGCRECAPDTWLHNNLGQRVHEALGFAETQRVVYCRKRLTS
jgi:hypothetical protein